MAYRRKTRAWSLALCASTMLAFSGSGAQAADQAHLRFRDERSDFLSLVALWEFFTDLGAHKLGHRRVVDAMVTAARRQSFLAVIGEVGSGR